MNKELFYQKYRNLSQSDEFISMCENTILQFEQYCHSSIEETTIDDIKKYSKYLVDQNMNKYNNYIHIARYYYYINYKEHYIHMTKYFNSHGVLENIINRITLYENEDKKDLIIKDITLPAFGTDSEDLPKATEQFMKVLNKHLDRASCNKILAGNNHGIPKESFEKEKQFYQKSPSLEHYLKERHDRKIHELQDHLDQNKVWFEQIVTPEAIELVKGNQEILSGVLQGDKLYITKIPYDINNFLNTEDDTLKRYYACHCTFVRENIKNKKADIPREWCNCSGGFAKFPFEVILDQELDIELISTPLDGDYFCRFSIDLSNIKYKKKPI
jgi:hypothetical protein